MHVNKAKHQCYGIIFNIANRNKLANNAKRGEGANTSILANIRNIFKGARDPKTQRLDITGRPSSFTAYSSDPYANDVYRAGVDAIARMAAKFTLTPTITFSDGSSAPADERLARLLQMEPNPLMTAYDMQYKLYTHLYLHNNAYAYIIREGGLVTGIYPLHVTTCKYETDERGGLWCHFTFASGKQYTLPYSDVIHLRRHFNTSDVEGDQNDAIAAGVKLADMQNKGIEQSIRTSGTLRGVLSFTQILDPEKLKALKEAFIEDYLTLENSGGVAALDQSATFTPMESKPISITREDQEATKAKIYNYLGIGESIVNGTFTDDEFGAFDESTIEALALQTQLEFTRKIYSPLQVSRGRKVECSTARLHFISTKSKVELLKNVVPMGMLTINQGLDLMGMPKAEEDRRIQSLNYIDVAAATEYQLARAGTAGSTPADPTDGAGEQ